MPVTHCSEMQEGGDRRVEEWKKAMFDLSVFGFDDILGGSSTFHKDLYFYYFDCESTLKSAIGTYQY